MKNLNLLVKRAMRRPIGQTTFITVRKDGKIIETVEPIPNKPLTYFFHIDGQGITNRIIRHSKPEFEAWANDIVNQLRTKLNECEGA